MEAESKKRSRNHAIKTLVLGSVAIAGVLSVGLVAPNVIGGMTKLGLVPKRRQDEYIHSARMRLKKQGFLAEDDGFLRITPKGQAKLRALVLSIARPPRLKRWDKKWRVLIFDIPEKRKGLRSKVRIQLQTSGFVRLQNSVWVYPYPCEEFVTLLKAELRVGKDLLYLIVDSLEGDRSLRAMFKLPQNNNSSQTPLRLPTALDTVLSAVLPLPDNRTRSV